MQNIMETITFSFCIFRDVVHVVEIQNLPDLLRLKSVDSIPSYEDAIKTSPIFVLCAEDESQLPSYLEAISVQQFQRQISKCEIN